MNPCFERRNASRYRRWRPPGRLARKTRVGDFRVRRRPRIEATRLRTPRTHQGKLGVECRYAVGSCVWVSKDAARWTGGLNFYAYAQNDPVNVVDPDGRSPFDNPYVRLIVCSLLPTLCSGTVIPFPTPKPKPESDGGSSSAGGSLPGTGGGERDDGICHKERELTNIVTCDGKGQKYCQYYCPVTNQRKTLLLPHSDLPCPAHYYAQSR